jgi:SdpC family antimicrobial peptide
MHYFRSFFRQSALAALMAVLVVKIGLGNAYAQHNSEFSHPYDGETLFNGLFLATGPIADLFPELWSRIELTDQQTQEIAGYAAQFSAHIKNVDPSFYERFAKEIQSGDRLRIAGAVEDAGGTFARYLEEDVGLDLSQENEFHGTCAAIVVVLVVVAVVAVAVWVVLDPPFLTREGASALSREILIDAIATRLAPFPVTPAR